MRMGVYKLGEPENVAGLIGVGPMAAEASGANTLNVLFPDIVIPINSFAVLHYNMSNSNVPSSAAAGFTVINDVNGTTRGGIHGKICEGNEQNETVVLTYASSNCSAFISVWRGIENSSVANAVATCIRGANTSSGNMTYATMTAGQDALCIAQGNGLIAGGTPVNPSGSNPTYLDLGDASIAAGARCAAFYGFTTNPEALGDRGVAATGFTNFYNGIMLALKIEEGFVLPDV